ncbi:MAG: lysozyme [Thaumarchaeota archaeon]|nr:lysozyme [Nitrososphaerota archaeon]
MWRFSDEGINVLVEREGCKLQAYKDTRGIWTIGMGHTAYAGKPIPEEGMTITYSEAKEIFNKDLSPVITVLNECPWSEQYQFDACVSLVHNIGVSNWLGSTTRRMVMEKHYNSAAEAIKRWNRPEEIIPRRMGEYVEFKYGEYVARIYENV